VPGAIASSAAGLFAPVVMSLAWSLLEKPKPAAQTA